MRARLEMPHWARGRALIVLLAACTAIAAAGFGGAQPSRSAAGPPRHPSGRLSPGPVTVDCAAGVCRELRPLGDAPQILPSGAPSPIRGFADASIRRDPTSGWLWMAYSWPHLEPTRNGMVRTAAVSIHLAHSDDAGVSWKLDGEPWPAGAEFDRGPRGEFGVSSHEVATLAPLADGRWAAGRLSYFIPEGGGFGDRLVDSFRLEVVVAASPLTLGAVDSSILRGPWTASGWGTGTQLSGLDPRLASCDLWNEPALLATAGQLYLAAVCLSVDRARRTRDPDRELVALFATTPTGPVTSWEWRFAGILTDAADAAALGGETLVQVDLARGRRGGLLAIVSPSRRTPPAGPNVHLGCLVLDLVGLDPPRLRRFDDGRPVVRASVTATDLSQFGPGSCGYDPASATGMVIARRVIDLASGGVVSTLHASGLAP